MKLSNDDVRKIEDMYSLKVMQEPRLIEGGVSNYNFELITDKGNFMARFSSFDLDEKKVDRLKLQIRAINHLAENGFSYQLPTPLKSKNGNFVEKLGTKHFWINKKIEGTVRKESETVDLKELAKLMAQFHKKIETMELNLEKERFADKSNLITYLKELRQKLSAKEEKNKFDLIVEEYLPLLEKACQRANTISVGTDRIFTHSDWFIGNLIHRGEQITGLIDFDNFEIAPRAKDVAIALQFYCLDKELKWDKKLAKEFVTAYEEIYPLDKFEKYNLKDYIITDSCYAVVFLYLRNKKASDEKKLFMLEFFLKSTKNLMEDIEREDYY